MHGEVLKVLRLQKLSRKPPRLPSIVHVSDPLGPEVGAQLFDINLRIIIKVELYKRIYQVNLSSRARRPKTLFLPY